MRPFRPSRGAGLSGIRQCLAALALAGAVPWAATPAHAFDDDVWRFSVSMGYQYDSNLFRLPDAYPIAALTGRSQRSDTSRLLSAMLSFDRQFRRQRLQASISVDDQRYRTYAMLDSTGYDAAIQWQLDYLTQSSARLAYRRDHSMLGFADFRAALLNMVTSDTFSIDTATQWQPRWSILANLRRAAYRNDTTQRRNADFDQADVEAGVRYTGATDSRWDLVWRHSEGDYPKQPNPLYDPSFRENAWQTRVLWGVPGATRVSGQFGWVDRRNTVLSQRSYRGAVWRIQADWLPSDKFALSATYRNDLSSYLDLSSSHALMRGLSVRARWAATDKTTLQLDVDWLDREFRGNPGLLAIESPGRRDRQRAVGLTLTQRPTSWLEWSLGLRREMRDSNVAFYDYDANVFFVTLAFRN
ncbi:MAG: hypothetical protein QM766_12910 [Burkholderiaceae bacterium]